MKIKALWLGASLFALGCAGSAFAAEAPAGAAASSGGSTTIGEVVVTAERRTTDVQKTAIAATVLSGQDIIKKGVFTVDQLQFVSPSLTVNNFGQGNDFNIRGIGKGEHNTQTSTGVVTYRDGVATFPGYIQEEPYFDIASVEVLRGPQGTFSGQNATGGAVIVNTQNPVIDGGYDGYLMGHYGNYNDTGLQGAVNLPISDTLAARVAFNTEYRDTFYHISGPWTGNPNLAWGSGRFSLLWQPNNALKVLWKTDYGYFQNGGYFGDAQTNKGTSNLFNFANNYHTYATDQFVRSILRVDYVNPNGVTFRSVSGYQLGRTAWKGDIDGTDAPSPNYIINEAVNEQLWSQEFNIISPDKGPVTWVLGAYYQQNQYYFPQNRFDIGVPPGGFDEDLYGVNATHTAAGFGQVSFNMPAGFQLQVGARYSIWYTTNRVRWLVPEYNAYGYNYFDNQTERGQNITGKVALNWNLNADNFLYVFVASGAKPGGLNGALYGLLPSGDASVPAPFGQEYVTDYEVGWKASFFDRHLRTQLGAYYNDYRNFQVILPIANDPAQSTEVNDTKGAKLYGLEASAELAWGDFSGSVGMGLEHSELGTFYAEDSRVGTSGACNPQTGPSTAYCLDLKGHPQTYAPNLTFNTAVQYTFRLANGDKLTPGVSYSYISDQWGTLFDNRAAGDYLAARNILGATIAWTHGGFTTTLYGSNLLDDHYVSALLTPIRLAGAPRQYGISLMKTF